MKNTNTSPIHCTGFRFLCEALLAMDVALAFVALLHLT